MSASTDTVEQTIEQTLSDSRTIAIVGLSEKPERDSHVVGRYLQAHGYRVIPVNPAHAGQSILNERCYATLKEAARDLGEQGIVIDVVDCFRRSEAIPDVVAQAIEIGAPVLWLQLGVTHPEAERAARQVGMKVIVDRCMKIETQRRLADGRSG